MIIYQFDLKSDKIKQEEDTCTPTFFTEEHMRDTKAL